MGRRARFIIHGTTGCHLIPEIVVSNKYLLAFRSLMFERQALDGETTSCTVCFVLDIQVRLFAVNSAYFVNVMQISNDKN